MIRPLAFCAGLALGGNRIRVIAFTSGLALAWCANAEAQNVTIAEASRRDVSLTENREWCFLDEGKATRLAICPADTADERLIDTGILIDPDRWGKPLDGGLVKRMPASIDPTAVFAVLVEDYLVDNNTHQSETLFVLSKTQLNHIIEQHGGKP